MTSLNDTVDTVNAAASAIVSADARVQPTTSPKRRWRRFWRLYWCFGSHKNSKRIRHAVLVPEPVLPGAAAPAAAAANPTHSTNVVMPFIAPPSSPASFLQSDPPSSTQSPAGLLSLASLSVKACSSPRGPASIFAIGPYTYETQLVSPPVFSTFTTEPSTAPYTPPPESVHQTTPSSPEVPFAQLLTSSLDRTRRNSGNNPKFAWSHYEFQSYQLPGSPGGHLISPGSVISNSGTSSPFPDRRPILGFRLGEAPKLLGFEHFNTRKWGSRLGSGSITPEGVGLGSRLGSGCVTPDGTGLGSRLGSGSLTPDGMVPITRDNFLLVNSASPFAHLANGSKSNELVINHRVSFELTGEDVARCLANKSLTVLGNISESPLDTMERDGIFVDAENDSGYGERSNEMHEASFRDIGEQNCNRKHRSVTLGSAKEFKFDSTKGEEVSDKPAIGSKWWANEKVVGLPGKDATPTPTTSNHWTFFSMLQPGVS